MKCRETHVSGNYVPSADFPIAIKPMAAQLEWMAHETAALEAAPEPLAIEAPTSTQPTVVEIARPRQTPVSCWFVELE